MTAESKLPNGSHTTLEAASSDKRKIFFFDIDNCLYPKSYKIHERMSVLIDAYFQSHLALSPEEAGELHQRYYKDYGLALEGLVRHHKVEPLEYNAQVDDALPLQEIIKPDPKLREMLLDLDTTRVKPWLFTNAYVNHGRRVVQLLGIEDLFEGITYCDYAAEKLLCKPDPRMFEKAMREAGGTDVQECYYVDDSTLNAKAGKAFGWHSIHLVEEPATGPSAPVAHHQIENILEVRQTFPELFKSTATTLS